MKILFLLFFSFFSLFLCLPALAEKPRDYTAIPLDKFNDVVKHWHDQHESGQQIYYSPGEIFGIAENILLYQRSNGGWPTNQDPRRILSDEEIKAIQKHFSANDSSLDNRNTHPQIRYLAAAYQQTQDPRYRDAAIAGLNYILTNQYSNGGWGHSPPRTDSYYGHITIADDVMPEVLSLLRDITSGHKDFQFLSAELQNQCKKALALGDRLLLKLQVKIDGVPTAWAGQYDRISLQPVGARSYELPGIISWESVSVVRYLMSIENPNIEVITAVEGAISWFEKAKITGIRIEKFAIAPTQFEFHTSNYDLRVVKDAKAPAIWARFYDLNNRQPFFANRDGSKVHSLAEVKLDRRTGYDWYGYWPQSLIEKDYPEWKKKRL